MKQGEVEAEQFLVLGAARSGMAAARLLKRHRGSVKVSDQKTRAEADVLAREFESDGIPVLWDTSDPELVLEGITVLVKSPGIPQTNAVVIAARRRGIRVISEIELASVFLPEAARLIAVTGTNGKTTTTAWLTHMLKSAGVNAVAAGNIGDAWCNLVDNPEYATPGSVFVVECSSFQLEDLEDFRPHIALVTNLSPDHMDRYNDRFDEYVAAKRNIATRMGPDDLLIINAGNSACLSFAEGLSCRIGAFGARDVLENLQGVYAIAAAMDDERLALRSASTDRQWQTVCAIKDLPIPGTHNAENAMAALAAASEILESNWPLAKKGLLDFSGVEHRIEFCGEREDGVRFYNDSKATNLDAMEQALKAFGRPVIVIAGGRDAHSDYHSIEALVRSSIKHLVTVGEAAELIENAWAKLVPTERAASMDDAVRRAASAAQPRDVVVLSPGCKSFDMYNNFEERGRDFKEKVRLLLRAEN
jgi:UDP-N-acetylmuramoylalanine--D-glutamate ligase